MRPSRWIFDHIPKTAGTTSLALLRSTLGADAVTQLFNGTLAEHAEKTLIQPIRVAGGHLMFRPGHVIPDDVEYFTILRDPVDRALSVYFYTRHLKTDAPNTFLEEAQKMTLHDFVFNESPKVRNMISDVMTRHLASPMTDFKAPLLSRAVERLQCYGFVGFVESLDESLLLLAAIAGWPAPPVNIPLPELNVSRHFRGEIDPQIVEHLREINQCDISLYDHARKKQAQCLREFLRTTIAMTATCNFLNSSSIQSSTDTRAHTTNAVSSPMKIGSGEIYIVSVQTLRGKEETALFCAGDALIVRVRFASRITEKNISIGIAIQDAERRTVFGTNLSLLRQCLEVEAYGEYQCDFTTILALGDADYRIVASVHPGEEHIDRCFEWRDPAAHIKIAGHRTRSFVGLVSLPCLTTIAFHGTQMPLHDFSSRVEIAERLGANNFRLQVCNYSLTTWRSVGPNPIRIGCKWLDAAGLLIQGIEGARRDFIEAVAPGISVEVEIVIGTPPPTAYTCRFTLVQEAVAWFDEQNGGFQDMPIAQHEAKL